MQQDLQSGQTQNSLTISPAMSNNVVQSNQDHLNTDSTDADPNLEYELSRKLLNVPFVSEAPDNNWTGSWKNACEEASITMVDKYYQGIDKISIPEEKKFMQTLFDAQVKLYGSDANSDSIRTMYLIDKYAIFTGDVINDPTIDDIISEIDQGRPVIAFHRGFDLKNENIPFLSAGSSYHSTVVVGYNIETRKFIVHDPGDTPSGNGHLYDFDLYMNSLHDYNYKTQLADGPARAIFTKLVEN